MKIFLFAGLLEIVFGIGFLVAPLPRAGVQDFASRDANMEVQPARGARVSPIISVVLLASGIILIITCAPRRRKPEQRSRASSPITRQATRNASPKAG
jgi:hypothetical protein